MARARLGKILVCVYTRLFFQTVALMSRDSQVIAGRLRLKCDGTRAETRFRLLAKRTSSFKSAGASVQSTTGSRGVRISGSNVGYTTKCRLFHNATMFGSCIIRILPIGCAKI